MKSKSLLVLALIVASITPSIARANDSEAGEKKGPNPAKMIQKLDADKNGTLSASEVAENKGLTKRFAKLDKDGNGQLDEKELAKGLVKKPKKEKKEKAEDSGEE
jgi:Ca2+-binding EF-hand superfamily protein